MNEQRTVIDYVSEFAKGRPEIPLPSDVLENMPKIKELLQGEPVFVTLPVAKSNSRSRNGRIYTENAVKKLVDQINSMRPEGIFGHIENEKRATSYTPPAIRWLVAEMQSDGTAWAKGLALTKESADYFNLAEATLSRVGTSVYGKPPIMRNGAVHEFELEKLDIADPTRAGLIEAVAVPYVTSEMTHEDNEEDGDKNMSDQLISELTKARDDFRDEAADLRNQVSELQAKIDEATRQIEEFAKLNLGENPGETVSEMRSRSDKWGSFTQAIQSASGLTSEMSGDDPIAFVESLMEQVQNANEKTLTANIEARITEMVPVAQMRPAVAKHISLLRRTGDVFDNDTATEAIREFFEDESIQALAKTAVSEQVGGNIMGGGDSGSSGSSGVISFEKTMEIINGGKE